MCTTASPKSMITQKAFSIPYILTGLIPNFSLASFIILSAMAETIVVEVPVHITK